MPVKEKLEENELCDVAILAHGFAPYMRDYDVLIETMWGFKEGEYTRGRYLCCFTHCPEAHLITMIRDENWLKSWSDTFIDYATWEKSDEPGGFIWGVCWSNAYPGFSYVENSELAAKWSLRFQKEMHEATIETNVFTLQLIFHDFIIKKVSDEVAVIDKFSIPVISK